MHGQKNNKSLNNVGELSVLLFIYCVLPNIRQNSGVS